MTYAIEKDWTTKAGLKAVVIISLDRQTNHRCGYVAVPPNHPAYNKNYMDQLKTITQADVDSATLGAKSPFLLLTARVNSDDDNKIRRSLDIFIDVHGGLTFSSKETSGDYPVKYKNLWWFGYDCAHYGDDDEGGRSLDYCINECERLANQLKAL